MYLMMHATRWISSGWPRNTMIIHMRKRCMLIGIHHLMIHKMPMKSMPTQIAIENIHTFQKRTTTSSVVWKTYTQLVLITYTVRLYMICVSSGVSGTVFTMYYGCATSSYDIIETDLDLNDKWLYILITCTPFENIHPLEPSLWKHTPTGVYNIRTYVFYGNLGFWYIDNDSEVPSLVEDDESSV